MRSRFRILFGIFWNRFFESDNVSPGGGFETNIWQILGFVIAIGWFISYFVMPPFLRLSLAKQTMETEWAIRSLRLFFTAYSFSVIAFAAIFEWDTLFPDRRDFLVLGPFPLRLREMLLARAAALGAFLFMLIAAMNAFPVLMMLALSALVPSLHGTGLQLAAAQIAATGGASLFAFLLVAALQGVLISLLPPGVFRRISPAIQSIGMSLAIGCILMYPLYSILLPSACASSEVWPWLFPPVWFAGVYDLIAPGANKLFVTFGIYATKAFAMAAALAAFTWVFGFRRHYTRTLESEDTPHRSVSQRWIWPAWLFRSHEERAIADFTSKTLARSQKHQLFVATWMSVGLSIGVLFTVAIHNGKLVISQNGLQAFPFLVTFFVISGFRSVFQFPAELNANWLFRITESGWAETARSATRKCVLASGFLPTLALVLLPEFRLWAWPQILLHGAFQLLAGALLIEAMFWTFDKVPFTCSYFPGKTSLSLLAGLYLYGFTNYSFNLAELERAIEKDWRWAALVFPFAVILLGLSWRRHPASSAVRFAAEDPLIQTLSLSE